MPLDAARWQIEIAASDKTAAAFSSATVRMKAFDAQTKAIGTGGVAAFGRLSGAVSGMVPALSAASVAWSVWQAGMRAADIGEQADQIGMTTDELQAYRLAAAQAGISNEQLDSSMIRLNRAMSEAGAGNVDMIAKFERLGVELLDANGQLRTAADAAPDLARGLLALGNQTERNGLMFDFFGRAGQRNVTLLRELAQGNDALVAAARGQGAIIGPDAIKSWDSVADRMKVVQTQWNTLTASLAAVVALPGIERILEVFESTRKEIQAIERVWNRLTSSRPPLDTLVKREATIRSTIEAMETGAAGEMDDLAKARLAGLKRELKEVTDQMTAAAAVEMPEVVVTSGKTGGSPKGKPSGGGGIAASNRALEESKKLLDDMLQNFERLRKAGEGVMDRFGDGTAYAAREIEDLNELLQLGYIDVVAHGRAVEEVTARADDMARAYRGAQGGLDAFLAGIEQGIAAQQRQNTMFEAGQALTRSFDEAIDALAGTSSRTFGQIAADFGMMLLKMEARAQLSNVWNAIAGKGPTDQGILGSIIGSILGSIGGTAAGTGAGGSTNASYGGSLTYGGPRAGGGDVMAGRLYTVGEQGREGFIPHVPGRIVPNGALGGGNVTVNVINAASGTKASTRERQTSSGREIEVLVEAVDSALAGRISRGTGAMSQVLAASGTRPRPRR
jgi:hypothetical protein